MSIFNDVRLSETLPNMKGGLKRGIVQKNDNSNNNSDGLNKVIVMLVDEGIKTPPAFVLCGFLGENSGNVIIPKPGQEVLVGFLNGELRDPVILGCLYNSKAKPPIKVDDKNDIMHFAFPGGMIMQIDNTKDKQKVNIKTKKEHQIILDDDQETVTIAGKDNNTGVKIDFKNGIIEIKAKKSLSFQAGTGDKLILEDGKGLSFETQGGDLKAKGTNVDMQAQANFKIKANANFEAAAQAQAKVTGQAGVECSSSAIATFKGNPLMIN